MMPVRKMMSLFSRYQLWLILALASLTLILLFLGLSDLGGHASSLKRIQDRINELQSVRTDHYHFCRHNETIKVPVFNNVVFLPCKPSTPFLKNHVKIYKITPFNKSDSQPQIERIPLNDSRVLEYNKDFGFPVNISEDGNKSFTYSCEADHSLAGVTFVNISLALDDDAKEWKYVEIEPDCKLPLKTYSENDLSHRSFFCNAEDPDPLQDTLFTWFNVTKDGNQEQIKVQTITVENKAKLLHKMILRSNLSIPVNNKNLTGLLCQVNSKNSSKLYKANYTLEVHDSYQPEIELKDIGTELYDEEGLTLTCIFKGERTVDIIWYKDGIPTSNNVNMSEQTLKHEGIIKYKVSTLSRLESPRTSVNYTCEAFDRKNATDSKTFIIRKRNFFKIIALSLSAVLPGALLLVLACAYYRNIKRWRRYMKLLGPGRFGVNCKEIKLYEENIQTLGKGKHGVVYALEMDTDERDENDLPKRKWIAAKTFTRTPTMNEKQAGLVFEDWLMEIGTIRSLFSSGKKDEDEGLNYIVEYIGWVAPSFKKYTVFLIMEMCEPGALDQYLRTCNSDNRTLTGPYLLRDIEYGRCQHRERRRLQSALPQGRNVIGVSHLIKFIEQLVKALIYLHKCGFVHGDLATRNVMLATKGVPDNMGREESIHDYMVLKLGDFGKARSVDNCNGAYIVEANDKKTTYCCFQKIPKSENKKPRNIPVVLYPIEVLKREGYTKKADVWSFGVLLWEIFELGKKDPYYNVDALKELTESTMASYLEEDESHRLPVPALMRPHIEISRIMEDCFKEDKDLRPTFTEILDRLQEFSRNSNIYEVDEEDEEQNDADNSETNAVRVEPGPSQSMVECQPSSQKTRSVINSENTKLHDNKKP